MEENKIIDGVGKDAEIVVNENGGKQSKSPMALHLIDGDFLFSISTFNLPSSTESNAIEDISYYMKNYKTDSKMNLRTAITRIEPDIYKALIRIGKVLQEGAEKYEANNWRLIPQEEHINHALIHLVASAMGDTQDNHLDHALCRLMMAHATKVSEGFDYNEYVKKVS